MLVETLESRRLLDATSVATLQSVDTFYSGSVQPDGGTLTLSNASVHITRRGTLVVKGGAADDLIHVRQIRDQFHVEQGSSDGVRVTTRIPLHKVKRILLEGAGGDDYLQLSLIDDRPATLTGEAGNDVLVAQRGDTLIGGDGDDKLVAESQGRLQLQDLLPEGGELPVTGAPSLLQGGAGRDRLYAIAGDKVHGGGGGGDRAVLTFRYVGGALPPLGAEPDAYARQRFGDRAAGIESFGTQRSLLKVTVDEETGAYKVEFGA